MEKAAEVFTWRGVEFEQMRDSQGPVPSYTAMLGASGGVTLCVYKTAPSLWVAYLCVAGVQIVGRGDASNRNLALESMLAEVRTVGMALRAVGSMLDDTLLAGCKMTGWPKK